LIWTVFTSISSGAVTVGVPHSVPSVQYFFGWIVSKASVGGVVEQPGDAAARRQPPVREGPRYRHLTASGDAAVTPP
jgi:hypothetical protein